jgi:hypothetical protein
VFFWFNGAGGDWGSYTERYMNWALPRDGTALSYVTEPAILQVFIRMIVVDRWACWIPSRPPGHEDDHPLPRPGQDYAVRILQVESPLSYIDLLPPRAAEAQEIPSPVPISKIRVPADADPVKFEPLNVKLRRDLLAIKR